MNIYKDILEVYGKEGAVSVAIEEMSDLISILLEIKRGEKRDDLGRKIISVELSILMLKQIYSENYKSIKLETLGRLRKMITEAQKEILSKGKQDE